VKRALRLLLVSAGLAFAAQHGLGERSNETAALAMDASGAPLEYEGIGILKCYSSSGELLPGANGRITIDSRGRAIVKDGRFELPPVTEATLNRCSPAPSRVTALELEGLDVVVSSSNLVLHPNGETMHITAAELPEIQLAVFDASTGAELDEVQVVQGGYAWSCPDTGAWQPNGLHLFDTAVASPIDLSPHLRQLSASQEPLRIGSPGYAWQALDFDPFEPAHLEVRLEPEARLAFDVDPELFGAGRELVIGDEMYGILIEIPLDDSPLPELGGLPDTVLRATVLSPRTGTFQALASTSIALSKGATATAKLRPDELDPVEVSLDFAFNANLQGAAPFELNTGSLYLTPTPVVGELGPYGYALKVERTAAEAWRFTGHAIPPGDYMLMATGIGTMEYAITVPKEGLVDEPIRIPRTLLPSD